MIPNPECFEIRSFCAATRRADGRIIQTIIEDFVVKTKGTWVAVLGVEIMQTRGRDRWKSASYLARGQMRRNLIDLEYYRLAKVSLLINRCSKFVQFVKRNKSPRIWYRKVIKA